MAGKQLAERIGVSFPLLSDPGLQLIDAYGVRHGQGRGRDAGNIARPAIFIVRDGKVAWRTLTDNWRIRPGSDALLAVLADL